MILRILACAAIGYLLGSISPSYIIGALRGYDPKAEGSGNPGASNTLLLAGKAAFFLVAILDILKSMLAWKICAALFPETALAGIVGGVGAVFGHLFPVWYRFRGGKGLACLGGLCVGIGGVKVFTLMLGVAILLALIVRYLSVVTVTMSVVIPVYYGVTTGYWLGALVLALPVIPIFCKHLVNFRRIRSGKELKLTYLFNRDKELRRIGREG